MLTAPPLVGSDQPLHSQYENWLITPSDSTDLAAVPGLRCVGIYVGQAGNVAALTPAGVSLALTAVPAGTILDIAMKRVLATGTTATALQALYRPVNR